MRGRASERACVRACVRAARPKPKAKCAIRQRPHRAFRQSLEIGDNLTRNHLPLQVGGALVLGQRANDPVVLVLLHDVRAPTRDAGCHKDRRVLRHRNAHDEVRHPAWEVHVRMDVLVAQHDRLDFIAHGMLHGESCMLHGGLKAYGEMRESAKAASRISSDFRNF